MSVYWGSNTSVDVINTMHGVGAFDTHKDMIVCIHVYRHVHGCINKNHIRACPHCIIIITMNPVHLMP